MGLVIMSWDQWLIAATGVPAIILVNAASERLRRWGPVLGLLGQPAWFYSTFVAEQWGTFFISFFYLAAWLLGFYNGWLKLKISF